MLALSRPIEPIQSFHLLCGFNVWRNGKLSGLGNTSLQHTSTTSYCSTLFFWEAWPSMRFSAGMQVLVSDTCRFPGNAALVCTLLLRALPRFLMRAHTHAENESLLRTRPHRMDTDIWCNNKNIKCGKRVCVCVWDWYGELSRKAGGEYENQYIVLLLHDQSFTRACACVYGEHLSQVRDDSISRYSTRGQIRFKHDTFSSGTIPHHSIQHDDAVMFGTSKHLKALQSANHSR